MPAKNVTENVEPQQIVATLFEKYKHEVPQLGQVISINHDSLELEWLTGCYPGTQERGDITICVIKFIDVKLMEDIQEQLLAEK